MAIWSKSIVWVIREGDRGFERGFGDEVFEVLCWYKGDMCVKE